MISFLIPTFYFLIYASATLAAVAPIIYSESKNMQLIMVLVAPVSFALTFVIVAGLLSRFGKPAIIQGSFERSLKDKVYGPRRLYGACWTALYYFSPLYTICLAIPPLKKLVFRLFGYSGSTDFIVYPDSWVRDLPCLLFEEGVYIANKSTIGTNMCLMDGKILVDRVKMSKKAMLGHMAVIGPGAKVRENVEIGLGVTSGIRIQFKKNSKIGPCAGVNHGSIVGENSVIGPRSYIGLKAVIGDNIVVPAGANIPAGATLHSQEDVDKYYSSESVQLQNKRQDVMHLLHQEEPLNKVG